MATKDFTAELIKAGVNKKTPPEVAQQLAALLKSWAEDGELKRGPLGAQFIAAHAQLGAQGVGTAPGLMTFNPLVAQHGDHEFVASAAPQPVASNTSSTRGAAHHVAPPEPPGQVRLISAPPAAPGDAPLSMVEDDALPGVDMAAAAPPPAAPRPGAEGRAATAVEAAEAEAEEEQALQIALAASLADAHQQHGGGGSPPPPPPVSPPAAPAPPLAAAAGEMERLRADVATLQANVALFAECLAAAESAADARENEVLGELLPGLQESQPRVLHLLEGGDVSDEALVVQLLDVHEQLSQCLAKYRQQIVDPSSAPPPQSGAPPPPVAAPTPVYPPAAPPVAETAARAVGEANLIGDLTLTDDGDLDPRPPLGAPPPPLVDLASEPTPSPADELTRVFQPPPPLAAAAVPTPAAPGGMQMYAQAAVPPAAPPQPQLVAPPMRTPPPPTPPLSTPATSMPPPSMPPPSMPPPSMPPPSMPPPSMPPPAMAAPSAPPPAFAGTMPAPAAPSAPVVQILDL